MQFKSDIYQLRENRVFEKFHSIVDKIEAKQEAVFSRLGTQPLQAETLKNQVNMDNLRILQDQINLYL